MMDKGEAATSRARPWWRWIGAAVLLAGLLTFGPAVLLAIERPHGGTSSSSGAVALTQNRAGSSIAARRLIEGLEGSVGEQQHPGRCSIYVLDASQELAPLVGVPPCRIGDAQFWPHSRPGQGVDGQNRTPHYEAQHASIYWVAKAIRGSPYATRDLASADLVFVDSHCYLIRRTARLNDARRRLVSSQHVRVMVEGLQAHPRWAASANGSGFVLGVPHPALREVSRSGDACGLFNGAFQLVVEKGSFCPWDQDKAREGRALILPYVAVSDVPASPSLGTQQRPIFFFHRGSCPERTDVLRGLAAGKLLRRALVQALRLSAPDIDIDCSCGTCPWRLAHSELMQRMGSTVFCPLIAGDTQSSRRLAEVVLAGCIPVFVGPPFHTLPLADDVDYASFSVFFNMTNTSAWIFGYGQGLFVNSPGVLQTWSLDADLPASTLVPAATFAEVVAYLRRLPEAAIRAKQAALARERGKFMYAPPAGGGGQTELLGLVLRRLCEHAQRLRGGGSGLPP